MFRQLFVWLQSSNKIQRIIRKFNGRRAAGGRPAGLAGSSLVFRGKRVVFAGVRIKKGGLPGSDAGCGHVSAQTNSYTYLP